MKRKNQVVRSQIAKQLRAAREIWGEVLSAAASGYLRELLQRYPFSVLSGDLLPIDGRWYVTHAGLLRLAEQKGCSGIRLQPVHEFCDTKAARWAFKATVYKNQRCRGFVGYGDADPSNISPQVRGAEMRIAETRAVNRALRKAYGIGICSVEELGSLSWPLLPAAQASSNRKVAERVDGNGYHPLRDRLCLLIRQHQLDPTLVKAYAADFCQVTELRHANRQQVATFIKHLADYALNDRQGLLCQLNSYAPKPVTAAAAPVPNAADDSQPAQEETRGAA